MNEKIKQLGDRLAAIKTPQEARKVTQAFDDAMKGKEPPEASVAITGDPRPTRPHLSVVKTVTTSD